MGPRSPARTSNTGATYSRPQGEAMTETAQERDERRAEIILEAIARTDGSDDAGGNSRHAAKLIAASDAAVGMDYDALRKLVGEILDEAIKCRDILESRELL